MEEFIKHFAALFDETSIEEFIPQTKFRNLNEWSSFIALAIIAMVDEIYNIKLKGDDIRKADTIENLYNIIISKK